MPYSPQDNTPALDSQATLLLTASPGTAQYQKAAETHMAAKAYANTREELRKARGLRDPAADIWLAHYEGFCAGAQGVKE